MIEFFKKVFKEYQNKNEDNGNGIELKDYLTSTKRVKVRGVVFHIKKIQVMDYLEGQKVMQEIFSTYKTQTEKDRQVKVDSALSKNVEKIKSFMTDIIMAGVVKPELSRKKDDEGKIHVDEIFEDWLLAQELTKTILNNTYGKKN